MKKYALILFLFLFACSSRIIYGGDVNYTILDNSDLELVSEKEIDYQIRDAIQDFKEIQNYLDFKEIQNYEIIIDFHDNDPYLCKEFESGTCITFAKDHVFMEINLDYPYANTYHETMHYLLYIHNYHGNHHEWMKENGVCNNFGKTFYHFCADI